MFIDFIQFIINFSNFINSTCLSPFFNTLYFFYNLIRIRFLNQSIPENAFQLLEYCYNNSKTLGINRLKFARRSALYIINNINDLPNEEYKNIYLLKMYLLSCLNSGFTHLIIYSIDTKVSLISIFFFFFFFKFLIFERNNSFCSKYFD